MLVQYLVGICCAGRNPDAVQIVLGDLVTDTVAEKARDVDVTVTVDNGEGGVMAFQAYEVKRESRPLDVAIVEQLCAKLLDMPSVTYRAIVSTSGFTDAAERKARARDVELYELKPAELPSWAKSPEGRPRLAGATIGSSTRVLIDWATAPFVYCVLPHGTPDFEISPDDPMLDAKGGIHAVYPRFGLFSAEMKRRAITQIVRRGAEFVPREDQDGAASERRIPRHCEPVDVAPAGVHLLVQDQVMPVSKLTVTGDLHVRSEPLDAQYLALKKVGTGDLLMNAMVSPGPSEYTMGVLTFEQGSRTIGVHPVTLPKAHRNRINRLNLRPVEPDDHEEPEIVMAFSYPI